LTASGPTLPDVRFWLPDPDLRAEVTAFYAVDVAGPLHDHLHPEWGNVRFRLRGEWQMEQGGRMTATPSATLFGPTDRTARFETENGAMMGIGLTPIGWQRLIRGDASRLSNTIVPLYDRLGTHGDTLSAALISDTDGDARAARLTQVLRARLADAPPTDEDIIAVQQALLDDSVVDVTALASPVDMAERTLQRLCLRTFGFGPKRLLRRQRFLRTLDRIRDRLGEPLTDLVDGAYYDQAHFNRDFKAFMGMSPTAYYRSPREVMRRAADERARIVGASYQGLHEISA
jgi:AraC-like DNA-binding protein